MTGNPSIIVRSFTWINSDSALHPISESDKSVLCLNSDVDDYK